MHPRNDVVLPLRNVPALLSGIRYALIGGYGVNAWLPPRATSDIDFTIAADHSVFQLIASRLAAEGLTRTHENGGQAPSGPDFQRFASEDRRLVVEFLSAKTPFQLEVIQRAHVLPTGLRVATAEDLLVLKLIADRGKDELDIIRLCRLPDLDCGYLERWVAAWEVGDRLKRYRARGA